MGTDKAWLPFGSETMLQRMVRIVGEAVWPVVAVGAVNARLPNLPTEVRVVFDRKPQRGPLEGLAAGLAEMARAVVTPPIAAAFVASCDAPLLRPEFVRRMVDLMENAEVVVPRKDGRLHPLAAVYRIEVLPEVERRLEADQLRLTALVESLRMRVVEPDEFRDIDPQLQSLENVNDPEAYRRAILTAAV